MLGIHGGKIWLVWSLLRVIREPKICSWWGCFQAKVLSSLVSGHIAFRNQVFQLSIKHSFLARVLHYTEEGNHNSYIFSHWYWLGIAPLCLLVSSHMSLEGKSECDTITPLSNEAITVSPTCAIDHWLTLTFLLRLTIGDSDYVLTGFFWLIYLSYILLINQLFIQLLFNLQVLCMISILLNSFDSKSLTKLKKNIWKCKERKYAIFIPGKSLTADWMNFPYHILLVNVMKLTIEIDNHGYQVAANDPMQRISLMSVYLQLLIQ